MRHSLLTVAFTFAACMSMPALAVYSQTTVVYDGRSEPLAKQPSSADVKLIKRYGLPKARQAWRSDEYCTAGFEAIDVASGSFTKPGSVQRAVLYRYCLTGHDIANNGIAIIEGSKIVAHIVYNGGEDYSIRALADLNGDGLAEIVIGDGSTHQGYTNAIAFVIGMSAGTVRSYGTADVAQSDCGARLRGCKSLAYKITAKTGPNPVFYRESFKETRQGWSRSGPPVKYTLRKNAGKFRLVG